ncbi:MAG: MarR family transcriptional regulator [Peptococcaceae bacterium]|jgi:DNA-binding MarR family transcriptional regulator|nr:MarR family transcriptional regulator [Peptococcaceae bacterium]
MTDNEITFLMDEIILNMMKIKRLACSSGSWDGIRKSEFELLGVLIRSVNSDEKGMKVSELSRRLQITPAAVTHAINALEKNGYVQRFSDPGDRRLVLLKPTEKSKEVCQKIKIKHLEYLRSLIEYLGMKDSREFVRLQSLVVGYMEINLPKQASNYE